MLSIVLAAVSLAVLQASPLRMHHISSCSECGRPPRQQKGSWCPCPNAANKECHGVTNTNCTAFSFDDLHVEGLPLSPSICPSVPANAAVYCLKGTQDLWAGVPCPSPCTPPTPPAPRLVPVYHLPARCEEGDINALFQFEGNWHLMQQWHARPHTSVGHAVSPDLLHFTRIADVLSSGATADEQCYDGSASLVLRDGTLTPMLMIDGGCGEKGPGRMGCMESSGNGSTGGVTAFPFNLSDPTLAGWTRTGPTTFVGCDGSAGPSPIYTNAATGKHQLLAIHGGGEALFEATSGTYTEWEMVDKEFLKTRGGGGGLWHPLPPNVDGVVGGRWATNIMQIDAGGDGGPTFALVQVDAASSKVVNQSATYFVDVGLQVRYGQINNQGGTAAGGGGGDGRMIHILWFGNANGGACSAPDVDVGQLTVFRDLRFDPRLGETGMLVETPIKEYAQLRSSTPVGKVNALRIPSSSTPAASSEKGGDAAAEAAVFTVGTAGPSAADVELNITVGGANSISVGFACDASSDAPIQQERCGFTATFKFTAASATARGKRMAVQMTLGGSSSTASASFEMLPGEAALPLRVLLDTRSVEIFAGSGRGVYSGPLSYSFCVASPCGVNVMGTATTSATILSGAVWTMRSIF